MDVGLHGRSPGVKRQSLDESRPPCGSGSSKGSYNTSLHVFALFLILVLSIAACSFPIIVRRFPRLRVPHRVLFLSRHFGTGVIIATSFVHLLPTAFVSLTDPCLPPFWNEGYPAMAGLIAMVSVFVVVGVEMFFASKGAGHIHGGEYSTLEDETVYAFAGTKGSPSVTPRSNSLEGVEHQDGEDGFADHGNSIRSHMASPPGLEDSHHGNDARGDAGSQSETSLIDHDQEPVSYAGQGSTDRSDQAGFEGAYSATRLSQSSDDHHGVRRRGAGELSFPTTVGHSQQSGKLDESRIPDNQEAQRLLLQCLLLEAGILFHSIFIGMALSVATGTPFVVLLIAISFHQFFEGLALGSRIAAIPSFGPRSIKPWLMAIAYGTTTPAGQAIGLIVHKLYDPQSQAGLLTVGFMNSISSGLLLFAGLVELLAEDFLAEKSYETLAGRRRLEAAGAVVGGALLMALVGAWA